MLIEEAIWNKIVEIFNDPDFDVDEEYGKDLI